MAAEKRQPWVKWFMSDWRSDPPLRMCSLAGRGLWMDLLAIAHEAEPYGHVLVNGKAPLVGDIARIAGATVKDVKRLLAELEGAGVFSRTSANVIYSRRMVRDKEKAETDRANGKGGGNPRLKGVDNSPDKPPDKPNTNPHDNGGVNRGDKAQKPEARSQKPEQPSSNLLSTAPPAAELPLDRLARLLKIDMTKLRRNGRWIEFPGALVEWKLQGCDVDRDVWPTIERLIARGKPIHGPSYFTDAIMRARDDRIAALPSERELWETRVEAFKLEGWWPDEPPPTGYGPKPGEPGCLCPPELLIGVAA